MRNATHLRVLGNEQAALKCLLEAWRANPGSATLSTEIIRVFGEQRDIEKAIEIFDVFNNNGNDVHLPYVINILADILERNDEKKRAKEYLQNMPLFISSNDAMDTAIIAKRLGDFSLAHRYFEKAGEVLLTDVRAMHEFAQVKIGMVKQHRKNRYHNQTSINRLLKEAQALLERVLQMNAPTTRLAWVWRDLGRVFHFSKAPNKQVLGAYQKAIELLPNEKTFPRELKDLALKQTKD